MSANEMKSKDVLLIDDTCTLCNRSVNFIIKKGGAGNYLFLSLYSDEGKQYLKKHGLPENYDDSVVLVSGSRAYLKSDALLKIVKNLKGLFPVLSFLTIIPGKIRDTIYNFAARHRH